MYVHTKYFWGAASGGALLSQSAIAGYGQIAAAKKTLDMDIDNPLIKYLRENEKMLSSDDVVKLPSQVSGFEDANNTLLSKLLNRIPYLKDSETAQAIVKY